MKALLSRLQQWATLPYAVITLMLFGLNALLLGRLDQPLQDRAEGAPKLDLRFGYDLATVHHVLNAYGEDGRRLYVWNLVVDTPFPLLGSLAVSLFVLIAFRDGVWQKIALMPPLTFAATDLVENGLLFGMTQAYPAISPVLVTVTSVITQVKRTAFYMSTFELVLSVMVIAVLSYTRNRTHKHPPTFV